MTFYEECSAAIDEDIDTLWQRLGNLYEEEERHDIHGRDDL